MPFNVSNPGKKSKRLAGGPAVTPEVFELWEQERKRISDKEGVPMSLGTTISRILKKRFDLSKDGLDLIERALKWYRTNGPQTNGHRKKRAEPDTAGQELDELIDWALTNNEDTKNKRERLEQLKRAIESKL